MNEDPPQPKLCCQCRYFRDRGPLSIDVPICTNAKVPPKDLATGEREWADFVRKFGPCGKEGKFFEPKPPKITWRVRLAFKIRRWMNQ